MHSPRKRRRVSFPDSGEGEGEEAREGSEVSTRDFDKESWNASESKNGDSSSRASDKPDSTAPVDLFSTYSFPGVGEDDRLSSSPAKELGETQGATEASKGECVRNSKNSLDLLFSSPANGLSTSSARGETVFEGDTAFSFETDAALIDSLLASSSGDGETFSKETNAQDFSSSSLLSCESSPTDTTFSGPAGHRQKSSQSASKRRAGEISSLGGGDNSAAAGGEERRSGTYSSGGKYEAGDSSLVDTLARRSTSDLCSQEEVLVADDSSSLFSPPTMPEIQNVVASAHMSWRINGVDMWRGPDTNSRLDLRLLAISCRFAEYNPRKINACILRLRTPKCTALVFRSGRVMITGARSETEAEKAARLLSRILTFAYCGDVEQIKPPPLSLKSSPSRGLPALLSSGDSSSASSVSPEKGDQTGEGESQGGGCGGETDSHDGGGSVCEGDRSSSHCSTAIVPLRDLSKDEEEGGEEDDPGAEGKRRGKKRARDRKVCVKNFKVENVVASADCGVPVRLEGLAFEHKEFSSYEPELFSGLVYRYNPTSSLKAVLLVFVSGKVVITGCKKLSEVNEVFEALYPVLVRYRK
ncbi:tata-box binding protein tbp2 [Cystoisospora suis]|uniref:Tata-box binding protein tbp2 n=1 Tax=Cystoisospora suis TaxID=483139 RepID=A0A2C6L602_9APIC|nr:tata-box binding protein tbp2 [Cystoisospora suis]